MATPSRPLSSTTSGCLRQGTAHLHEDRRPQVLVSIPPVAGAAGAAAGAQDTLIQSILCGEKGSQRAGASPRQRPSPPACFLGEMPRVVCGSVIDEKKRSCNEMQTFSGSETRALSPTMMHAGLRVNNHPMGLRAISEELPPGVQSVVRGTEVPRQSAQCVKLGSPQVSRGASGAP